MEAPRRWTALRCGGVLPHVVGLHPPNLERTLHQMDSTIGRYKALDKALPQVLVVESVGLMVLSRDYRKGTSGLEDELAHSS